MALISLQQLQKVDAHQLIKHCSLITSQLFNSQYFINIKIAEVQVEGSEIPKRNLNATERTVQQAFSMNQKGSGRIVMLAFSTR